MGPRNLLLAVLAALLALAGLGLWLFGGGEGAHTLHESVAPGSPVAAASDSGPDLAPAEGERMQAPPSFTEQGLEIAAGVRVGGDGWLSGRVLERGTEAGLPGMRVELFDVPPAGARLLGRVARMVPEVQRYVGSGEPLATTGTDAAGAFRFDGVKAGTWFIQARGERHVPETTARVEVNSKGDGGPADVFVRAGGRVVGRVIRPNGSGAPRAQVTLLPSITTILESVRSGNLCWLEATADAEGTFVIPGVPPGAGYDIYAEGRGFALSYVLDVPVRAGEDSEVTIRARSGGTIQGRVVAEGAQRAPVQGAHVAAIPHGLRFLPFAPSLLIATHTTTDAQGNYTLRNVPPGDVDVVGYATGSVATIGPTVFVAEGSKAHAEDFELPGGPRVAGRVVDAAGEPLAGVRVSWDPIKLDEMGIEGSIAPFVARAFEGLEFPVTGEDGRFVAGAFPGEPPYAINLSKAGYAEVRHEWRPGEENADSETTPATDSEGEDDGAEIEIVMVGGGFIEGIVMDADELKPLERFTIKSDDLLAGEGIPLAGPFGNGVMVESEAGRFRLGPLEAGTVELAIDAPGYLTTHKEIEVTAGEAKRGVIVELFAGGIVRGQVVDPNGAAVAGAIVYGSYEEEGESMRPESWEKRRGGAGGGDGNSPKGLASYLAQLGVAVTSSTTSDDRGFFELDGVEPGIQRFGAVHRDFASSWSEPVLVIHGGGPVETEIVMTRGGSIFGTVVDRFDRPITGAIVIAAAPASIESEDATGDALFQGKTDDEGAYRIDHVAPGTYFMVLTRGNEALQPLGFLGTLSFDMVTVPEGAEVEHDIVDNSVGGTRVFGRVIAAGEEVGRGQVTAMGFEGESLLGLDIKVARIEEGGRYEFEGLAPGEYRLQVATPAFDREVRMRIDVPDVAEYPLDLVLPEGRIAGVVMDAATGEGISGAWLAARVQDDIRPQGILGELIGRETGVAHTSTEEDGSFSFDQLQAGTYEITVRYASSSYAPADPLEVELHPDERADDLEIRLEASLELSGTVRHESGDPIDDVRVVAWLSGRTETSRSAKTKEDGRFTLSGLAPGTYVVSASHEQHATSRLNGVKLERGGTEELAITLEEGILVTVRVLGADGRPVAGAAAQLVRAEGDMDPGSLQRMIQGVFEGDGVTNAEGELVLGRFLPGTYRLRAQRGAKRSEPEEVELTGGRKKRLDVRLP